MASYLWRKYADYVYTKWERTILWDMIDPYRRPKSFKPLVTIYIAAFYTGVIGSAITEQLYKEKYWEDHPGQAVPLMKPKFYFGPWKFFSCEVMTIVSIDVLECHRHVGLEPAYTSAYTARETYKYIEYRQPFEARYKE
ncbi:hypothetical protein CJ030_MR6G009329 [Morella rubra]|uniref:Embryo defective 2752 protein n=1 Tax=Morella rubra TaxID=262757 RepID=A0A6A1V8X5_9ROSI|nr:hypothetical protein CJ030_MR6G009329 [Morella rubra]